MKLLPLFIIILLLTHCCTYEMEPTEGVRKTIPIPERIPDDLEIDDTVWERELPPYYDDNY